MLLFWSLFLPTEGLHGWEKEARWTIPMESFVSVGSRD
jgi:hypothetical protein